MPAWSGGHCPECGDYNPEYIVHCRRCRALLNQDLKYDSVEISQVTTPQEGAAMTLVEPSGFLVECPNCDRELRINRKYLGERVQCKFCQGQFRLSLQNPTLRLHAFYANCPHCAEELRAADKYLGARVACKLCGGKIRFAARADCVEH